MDEQTWVAYYEAELIKRRGYDFPKGTVLKVNLPHDARFPDDVNTRVVRLLKNMRAVHGVATMFELRGEKDLVDLVSGWFEEHQRTLGRKVVPMPPGFTAGWG